ncbi:dTDP-glucose 4,6-dehydratase [Metabacillus halosaccharovorans]|uniref:dTDP-glucose 4,6-dehydratase n=1 Tax=Metabacillus halosaccharovorans TaxID=930124 RepID=A0ABT3DC88_9BACI|nr:dTDP-glucose 4,6-dehydratase [Metabacillus halosaccharovorans]MCV9884669.1 dTDP-glucose 4,6-dehydratase [Metabacillus halosaccharovorans]
MKVLVTGGAGFIGLNFIKQLLKKGIHIVNLDFLTYAANVEQLEQLNSFKNYTFVQGDIRDKEFLQQIFSEYDIRSVFHFAAESHVDNSIIGPEVFIETNIKGTFYLLEAARKHWMELPFKYKKDYDKCRFLHVSTDEVYGSLGVDGFFSEESRYAPNSPYSASKASSDMIVRSYHHTYGMNTVITNCSNNFGLYQNEEKFIPTVIRAAINHQQIPIYGNGGNVRDWLFVEEHCQALEVVFERAKAGSQYSIGGNNEKSNIQLAEEICSILDQIRPSTKLSSYKELITFVQDRHGHDQRYAINASKMKRDFGWEPSDKFEENLLKTINWYINKYGFKTLK